MNQNDLNQPTDYENLMESLAEFVSADETASKEYLQDEGVDIEKLTQRGLDLVNRLQVEARINLAKKKRKLWDTNLEKFMLHINNSQNISRVEFSDIRLNFREFKELNQDEKNRIMNDIRFLDFVNENNLLSEDD